MLLVALDFTSNIENNKIWKFRIFFYFFFQIENIFELKIELVQFIEQTSSFFIQKIFELELELVPKKFELAARYSWVNPDNPDQTSDNEQQEYTGGLSYYIDGHDLKLQANYSFFRNESEDGDQDDHVVQGMVTLAF